MKNLSKFLAVLTILAFSAAPSLVRAQDAPPPPDAQNAPPPPDDQSDQADQSDQGASFQTFYDQLGDQGTWVQTDNYGYAFQPNVSDPDWAPYTDGHWVYTDEGWTWVSDEPWGWATYHYGRWVNIDGTGWVWVPGYRWAPAWVSWRYGGGYCGWAPLPPETFVGAEYGEPGVAVGIGFHFGGDVDVSFNIGPGCYNFVRVGDLGERNYRGHFLDRSRNYTVINNTTNITNININRTGTLNGGGREARNFRGVAVGGPPINEVNAHARQHIQTVQLTAANQPGRSTLQGNSLAVYAPRVNPASVHQARPARVSQTIANPTFNRGDSITKPLAVTANVRPKAPTPEAIQAAQTAQLHAPAHARIATDKTPVRTPLTKPLTSLEPIAQPNRTPNATAPGANGINSANTVNPNAEHSAANAAFTGEQAHKPQVQSDQQHQPQQVQQQQAQQHQQQQVQQQQVQQEAQQHQPQQIQQQQAQAQQEAHHQQQLQAQQQQQAQAQQEAHHQQQLQAQQQQQAQAQQEAHHQQQLQSQQQQQAQAQQEAHHQQQQAQQEAQHHQQQQQPQPQAQHQQQPQPQAQHQQQPQPQGGGQGKKQDDKNNPQGH